MARIDVIGLGPGGADLLSAGSLAIWEATPHRFLRTTRHPAVEVVGEGKSFDELYESIDTFEELYPAIVRSLVTEARLHGRVAYAVPGSPSVAESTVDLLTSQADYDLEVVLHPALSFVDLAWIRLGVDPLEVGARLVDGHRFAECLHGAGGAALVAQCDSRFILSDIKLAVELPPDAPAVLLKRLGLPDEQVLEVAWADIDRTVEADHLTSLWIPQLPAGPGGGLDELIVLVDRLRNQDPWKSVQTHETLRRYLLEESYEVLEAIDVYDAASGEGASELAAELGDLLYQVVFHASLANTAGWFDLGDVIGAIQAKLLARHRYPGSGEAPRLEDLTAEWERSKQVEHGRESAFDGIPRSLPSLVRVMALVKKAEALGLDFPVPAGADHGASILAAALAAMADGVDPEDALRRELLETEETLRVAEQ